MTKPPEDNVIALYQKNAVRWAELRNGSQLEKTWLDQFLSVLPSKQAKIIDLGCGSGQPIAQHFIGQGCHITGVDGADALTEFARKQFPDHFWITADMRSLPPLGKFHGIIAWHSFFHLTHDAQRTMFKTFANLSLPSAVLMFTTGTCHGEAIGRFEGSPLYHSSLDQAEYRQLLRDSGFEVIRHVENDPACGGATVWLARKRNE